MSVMQLFKQSESPERTIKMRGISFSDLGDRCAVTVQGKDAAIALRQRLVRSGLACTFPAPVWKKSDYAFHVHYPAETSFQTVCKLIEELNP